jgi:ABC-type xylose transport system permease subunit
MAQTKRKRRRKQRGTQGGRIDTRPARGRARSRAEAKAQARSRSKKKSGPRVPDPPSWSSAWKKGAVAAVLFVGLLAFMGQAPGVSLVVGVLMLSFYIPMAFLLDRFMYQRYLRKEAQKRAER